MRKVAIIVRTKNRSIFLRRAIHSILSQTYQNYRAYIINDGGKSEDIHEVKKYFREEALKNFVFVDMPYSSGRGGALSIGLNMASEEYILIHDDDDTLEPTFLEKTVQYLENDKHKDFSGVVTSNYDVLEYINNNDIILKERNNVAGFRKGHIVEYSFYLSGMGIIITNSFLFKRSCISKIGNVKAQMDHLEDHDFFLRIMQCGEIGIISDFLCSYHQREAVGGAYDMSRHELPYDQHMVYQNNLIREAINSADRFKYIQASFVQNKRISEYNSQCILNQMSVLNDSFVKMTNTLTEILKKIIEKENNIK